MHTQCLPNTSPPSQSQRPVLSCPVPGRPVVTPRSLVHTLYYSLYILRDGTGDGTGGTDMEGQACGKPRSQDGDLDLESTGDPRRQHGPSPPLQVPGVSCQVSTLFFFSSFFCEFKVFCRDAESGGGTAARFVGFVVSEGGTSTAFVPVLSLEVVGEKGVWSNTSGHGLLCTLPKEGRTTPKREKKRKGRPVDPWLCPSPWAAAREPFVDQGAGP